jgi:arginyl-tRNA--protein-N-Asp/Glu arginylyltransferase
VFYDPEVSKQLELGKLTALWELQWVQHVRAHVSPRLRYYYMGFYVRSCQKMRYKVGHRGWVARVSVARSQDGTRWCACTLESGGRPPLLDPFRAAGVGRVLSLRNAGTLASI